MKKIENKYYIMYQAFDGTTFLCKEDCELYEKIIKCINDYGLSVDNKLSLAMIDIYKKCFPPSSDEEVIYFCLNFKNQFKDQIREVIKNKIFLKFYYSQFYAIDNFYDIINKSIKLKKCEDGNTLIIASGKFNDRDTFSVKIEILSMDKLQKKIIDFKQKLIHEIDSSLKSL